MVSVDHQRGSEMGKDPALDAYLEAQRNHWDSVASERPQGGLWGQHYHRHMQKVFKHHIAPGMRVIELGCGTGDLLASVAPDYGVGVDLSPSMVAQAQNRHAGLTFVVGDIAAFETDERFDVVILSDLANGLFDVQRGLQVAAKLCAPGGRIAINFFSHVWEKPLQWAGTPGMTGSAPAPNWLTPDDIKNLLHVTGCEIIRHCTEFLMPFRIPILEPLCNRILARIFPLNALCLTHFIVARPIPAPQPLTGPSAPSVTIVIPARNEAGNVESYFTRIPRMGSHTEVVIVEGHSTDDTYAVAEKAIQSHPEWDARLYRQTGKGKGDAVRLGFSQARCDILMILDADLTVVPEDLPRFYAALVEGRGEFINGVRLVYPMEGRAMRFLNLLGNKFFSVAFSWLLGQSIKDTLCGTKVLLRKDYERLAANRSYFGEFDPFGDYDLIFGAAKLGLKIVDLPIRYRDRTYGDTNIDRWRHGWLLLKMVCVAARRIKFV